MPSAVRGNKSSFATIFHARRGNLSSYARIGALQGINMGGLTGPIGASMGLPLQLLVSRENVQGTPSPPSLAIRGPSLWRFRWTIRVGTQTIRISCKQVTNLLPRPTLVVRANPDVGLMADVTATAPGSVTWCTIGPAVVTATAAGVVFVELHNNLVTQYDTAFFDNIIAT